MTTQGRDRLTAGRIGLLLLLLTLLSLPAAAQQRHPVVLLLCDGLTMDDVQSRDCPTLLAFAKLGCVGLVNDVVTGPKSFLSSTLTLAAGQQEKGEPTDAQGADEGESVPGERGTARAVYERRMGKIPTGRTLPQRPVWHLGWAGMERRGLATERLGAALAQATPPIRAELYGNADTDLPDRSALLLVADANGIGTGQSGKRREMPASPFGIADDPLLLMQALTESDAGLVVVQLGDLKRAEAARPHLSPSAYRQARHEARRRADLMLALILSWIRARPGANLLMLSSCPPDEPRPYPVPWTRLTPLLAYGPDFGSGLLTSPTTRTPGLLANVDIAPTVLHLLHVPAPRTMVGRPIEVTGSLLNGTERVELVTRKEFVAALNEPVKVWGIVPLVSLCLILIVVSMILRRIHGPRASRRFAWAIVFTQSLPAATLLAPILIPPTAEEYTLRIAAWMLALTFLSYGLARPMRVSPPVASAFLLIALLVADICMGQPLQKDSLLCTNAISGLRYYGIGNEYLGPLLASALSGLFAWLDDLKLRYPPEADSRDRRFLVALGWLALLAVLGWPGWGANAGSLACTGAGFGVGVAILRGRRVTLGLAAGCVFAGFLLAFVFGLLDAAHTGGATSHFGAALQASAGGRGAGYLAEIAIRKVGMNLRLLISPPFWLLAMSALLPLAAANALIGGPLRQVMAARSWSVQGLKPTLAALVAALIFKDSGVITAAGLFAVSCACPLYAVLVAADEPSAKQDSAAAETNQFPSAET